MGHAFSEDPDGDAGWDRDEVYRDTQRQRALEADVRAAKRQAANEHASDLERAAAKARIWKGQQEIRKLTSERPWLRRDASRERAPELSVQPRGAKNAPRATRHAAERMAERGITDGQVKRAIASPMHTFPVTVDSQGRKAQKIVGSDVTVVINPTTRDIITAYPTNKKMRRRYGTDEEAGADS